MYRFTVFSSCSLIGLTLVHKSLDEGYGDKKCCYTSLNSWQVYFNNKRRLILVQIIK